MKALKYIDTLEIITKKTISTISISSSSRGVAAPFTITLKFLPSFKEELFIAN